MKYQRGLRTVVYAVGMCVAICTAGCSASFCGLQLGGSEELTFSCGEEISEEALSSGQSKGREGEASSEQSVEQGSIVPSGQSAEQEEAASFRQTEEAEPVTQESEGTALEASGSGAVTADGRVNINQAGIEDLMTLKGIGETRAKAIVTYRTEHGAFTKAEDIMQVPGIKEGIFSKIQHQIAVD